MSGDRPVTRGEVREMMQTALEAFAIEFISAITGMPPARNGQRELEAADPAFAKAKAAVAACLRAPLVSYGDVGFRAPDGIHAVPLGKVIHPTTDDEADDAGAALRAIRRRRRARRE